MKKRIILLSIFILFIIMCMTVAVYFFIIGVKSIPTKELKKTCNIKESVINDRKIFTITSKNGVDNDLVIIYFHGGSYVAELSKNHWDFVKDLVEDTKSTIIVPDYPLTPKYNKDDVIVFTNSFYEEVLKNIKQENIIMMGDSAGGGLALGLCEKLSEEEKILPSKLLLISPWLDLSMTNPKIEQVQKVDKQLNKEVLELAGIAYATEEGLKDYFASPLYGPLKGLKNMNITIYTGTYDILNPDVHLLVENAKNVDVDVNVKEVEGKGHIWIIEEIKNRKNDESYKDLINIIMNNKE